jgi:NAD(P)-dependent dehydrogenase (short-subunit alcohol dehydrogenase family)
MFKVCITGTKRGLGKFLKEYFTRKGYFVVGLNRGEDIVTSAVGCNLFINNAYDGSMQLELFNELHTRIKNIVIMGSVAADYPDSSMPEYSQHKKELKQRVLEVANTGKTNILLLELTGASYNDPETIGKVIDFWLANPTVTCVSFVHGEPNG